MDGIVGLARVGKRRGWNGKLESKDSMMRIWLRVVMISGLCLSACGPAVPASVESSISDPWGTHGMTASITPFCQPPAYPGTIHYANFDNFGDGYIALIHINGNDKKSEVEIVRALVGQWLEHFKTQSISPSAAVKDYLIDRVDLLDPSCDSFFDIIAGVRFSIIPNQIPNDYASFPGDAIKPGDIWWHLLAPFGVFKDGNNYRLRLIFGWST